MNTHPLRKDIHMSKYTPRQPDEEVAYMVHGVWYEVMSDVQYLEGEVRFLTHEPGEAGVFEMHVMPNHVQAVQWPWRGWGQ